MISFSPRAANEWVTADKANAVQRDNGTYWPVSGDATVKRDGHHVAHDIDIWHAPNVSEKPLSVTERLERYNGRYGSDFRDHDIEPGDIVTVQGVGEMIVTVVSGEWIAGYRENRNEPGRWFKQSFRHTMVTKRRKPGEPEPEPAAVFTEPGLVTGRPGQGVIRFTS